MSKFRTLLDIALTFDDGYLDQFRVARTLSSFGVRATFFLIAGLDTWEGKPLLTRKKHLIREMLHMGHEIGSHTVFHPHLTTIGEDRAVMELAESRRSLEEMTGSEVRGFAYPFGSFNKATKALVARYYSYARGASDFGADRFDRYSIGIKHPGRNLAYCSVLRPLDVQTRRRGYVLLFHSVPYRSLLIWIRYLQSTGARFLTLAELVARNLEGS